jgi:hypothetical protein
MCVGRDVWCVGICGWGCKMWISESGLYISTAAVTGSWFGV